MSTCRTSSTVTRIVSDFNQKVVFQIWVRLLCEWISRLVMDEVLRGTESVLILGPSASLEQVILVPEFFTLWKMVNCPI